jgi:hypothetical protein
VGLCLENLDDKHFTPFMTEFRRGLTRLKVIVRTGLCIKGSVANGTKAGQAPAPCN